MKQKHNKSTLIAVFLLMIFATVVSVNAQPPFTQSSNNLDGTLEISTPKPLVFALDSNITSGHFHVFNSTGYKLTPISEVNCTLHIYDSLNKHALEQNLTADSNGVDLKVTLNQSYFSNIGDFGFIVWCESSKEAGFLSSSFRVTRTGLEYEDHTGLWSFVVLTLGIAGLLFWFGSLLDTDEEKDWLQAVKLLVNMIALFVILVGSAYIVRSLYLLNYPTSMVNIANVVYFVLLFTVIPVLLIFMVMFIKQLMEFWEDLRKGDDFG